MTNSLGFTECPRRDSNLHWHASETCTSTNWVTGAVSAFFVCEHKCSVCFEQATTKEPFFL